MYFGFCALSRLPNSTSLSSEYHLETADLKSIILLNRGSSPPLIDAGLCLLLPSVNHINIWHHGRECEETAVTAVEGDHVTSAFCIFWHADAVVLPPTRRFLNEAPDLISDAATVLPLFKLISVV